MRDNDLSGPAFPVKPYEGIALPRIEDGMSMRDYFAAKAINGMLANEQYDEFLGSGDFNKVVVRYAELAYKYADAMLLESAK